MPLRAPECSELCVRGKMLRGTCNTICELAYARGRVERLEGRRPVSNIQRAGYSAHFLDALQKEKVMYSMQTLQQLRAFDPASQQNLEEMMMLLAAANCMISAYTEVGGEVPEWLSDVKLALVKEIKTRSNDALERELKETEARLEALKSNEEKRGDLKAKAERLKAKLAAPA